MAFVTGAGVARWTQPSTVKCHRSHRRNIAHRFAFMSTGPASSAEGDSSGVTLTSGNNKIVTRKAALFSAVEKLDFGRSVLNDKEAQESIEQLLQALEAVNPTPAPAKSALLDGKWVLAYSTSERTTGGTRPAVFQADRIFQHLTVQPGAKEGTLQNQEEGSLLGPIRWKNVILGECKQLTDTKLRIKFNKFVIGGVVPVQAPDNLIGWQEHTFLDEDTRIVRTNYNNVVVMRRET